VDDPKVRQPDITRARTLLGWEPKVSLDAGLPRTLEYFRKKVGLTPRPGGGGGGAAEERPPG
jgi:dTDP-glucose 4,6-dehydratase